jgi:hypothetical protein
MKSKWIWLGLLLLYFCSCEKEDHRELFIKPLDPNVQKSELSRKLIITGTNKAGKMPETAASTQLRMNSLQNTASITNDNFLFIPFAFTTTQTITGMYLQIEGADNHWDVPIAPAGNKRYVLNVGIPRNALNGTFNIIYRLYDALGNMSNTANMRASIVSPIEGCGVGNKFPRVEGSDGLTVRTYNILSDQAGQIKITYETFTVKDRLDIRYNGVWVKSTGELLSNKAPQPPIKPCAEVVPGDGFVGESGTFVIDYDPKKGRKLDIYVSGCQQGDTRWYFDVYCAGNNSVIPSQSICGNYTAQDKFDITHPNYHKYPEKEDGLYTVICDPALNPNCSVSSVFKAMLKQSDFIAPTYDKTPVTDCKVTWVRIVTYRNPVITKINNFNYSITNYTIANYKDQSGIAQDHYLHPGRVVRTVKLLNGKVVVSTMGEGTGRFPTVNEAFSGQLWKIVDERLEEFYNKK